MRYTYEASRKKEESRLDIIGWRTFSTTEIAPTRRFHIKLKMKMNVERNEKIQAQLLYLQIRIALGGVDL